ncbi:nucleotidyltransferase substrate binding protein [bacterium]|nr:nucleotidyltransferase substrate binding protein [bacterium]
MNQVNESQLASTEPAALALNNLKEALDILNPTDLERDGTIQRFEYSYEIIWKLAQRILKDNEVTAETPKAVFRELGRLGWIDNVENWFEFQKSRNETSHEYGKALALKSYQLAKTFLPLANSLFTVLKTKANE